MVVSHSENTSDRGSLTAEIQEIASELARHGLWLRTGENFNRFSEEIMLQPKRHAVAPQFDPKVSPHAAKDAMWVCGFDSDGYLAHTQAMMRVQLGSKSLADYIKSNGREYVPATPSVHLPSYRCYAGPKARRLKGRSVYHGETWLRSDFRGQHIAPLCMRLGMYMCWQKWDPDFCFGLMSWSLACQGFATRLGFANVEPLAVVWDRADVERAQHQVWTVYIEREDLLFLRRLDPIQFSRSIAAQFHRPKAQNTSQP